MIYRVSIKFRPQLKAGSPRVQMLRGRQFCGVSYTLLKLLKVVAQKKANYTCVSHYAPKEFTYNSVMVRVTVRKEKADQLYAEYLEELGQYYIHKCEIDAYCETDGCNIDSQKQFQSCLTQKIIHPNTWRYYFFIGSFLDDSFLLMCCFSLLSFLRGKTLHFVNCKRTSQQGKTRDPPNRNPLMLFAVMDSTDK